MNESWGYKGLQSDINQRNHVRSLYYATKTLDPTRSINDNCGWEHTLTDLTTFHDYSAAPELTKTCASMDGILQKKSGKEIFVQSIQTKTESDPETRHMVGAPVICTEFGGINIKGGASGGQKDKDWGYTTAEDPTDLLQRLNDLMIGIIKGGVCCGFVYTQLTDIEQEVNGLYTFDRKPKLEAKKVRHIIERVKSLYYERVASSSP